MILFLTLVSGVAWTVVYIEAIRVGFRDRSYPIPIAALALNIAWESIHAAHDLATKTSVQGFVTAIWTVGAGAIVCLFFRFGRRERPEIVTGPLFAAGAALMFAAACLVQG